MNQHDFKFNIPLVSSASIVGPDHSNTELEMDGQPLRGVEELVVRAGVSGVTNVVIQFRAPVAMEFVATLVAKIDLHNENMEYELAEVYREAKQEAEDMLDGEDLEDSHFAQARLMTRAMEITIEKFKLR